VKECSLLTNIVSSVSQATVGINGSTDPRFCSLQPYTSSCSNTTAAGLSYCTVYSTAFSGTHCAYTRRDGQAESTWV